MLQSMDVSKTTNALVKTPPLIMIKNSCNLAATQNVYNENCNVVKIINK